MSSRCTSCGSQLPGEIAEYARCPSCGAVQPSNAPAMPSPKAAAGGPPKPPPRRPPPRQADQDLTPPAPPAFAGRTPEPAFAQPSPAPAPASNPFMDAPFPAAAAFPPEPASNPFLVQPEYETSPRAAQVTPEPARSAPEVGAPLRVQPGAVSPSIKDPHAEFRRGGWKKPAIFVGAAAVVLGGLSFALPSEPEAKVAVEATAEEPSAVIGRSVAPEVIEDPNNPVLSAGAAKEPERAPRSPEEEMAASPDRPDRSGSFADEFKQSAR